MTALAIVGGSVVGAGGVAPADVLIDGGAIVAVGPSLPVAEGTVVVAADGLLVAPGFIDLQINGAHGIDLTEEPERLWEVAAHLPRYGVTGVPADDRHLGAGGRGSGASPRWPVGPTGFAGAEPLGLHFEGPMLNPHAAGRPRSVPRRSRPSRSSGWSRAGRGRPRDAGAGAAGRATWSSERAGRRGCRRLGRPHRRDRCVSSRAAVDAGAQLRHPPVQRHGARSRHREPGPIGVALADDASPSAHRRRHPRPPDGRRRGVAGARPRALNLVTDAVAALGVALAVRPASAGRDVTVGDDGVRLADGTLAGSALSLDEAVRNLDRLHRLPVRRGDRNGHLDAGPRPRPGSTRASVAAGFDADLALLTTDLRVVTTVVGGREVHRAAEVVPWRS